MFCPLKVIGQSNLEIYIIMKEYPVLAFIILWDAQDLEGGLFNFVGEIFYQAVCKQLAASFHKSE